MQATPKPSLSVSQLVEHIKSSRCFRHPMFEHWAAVQPPPRVLGALFHQIRCFCDSTRPGGKMPEALARHGLSQQSRLLEEIVASEANHGPELATMAGHILNRAAGKTICPDLYDQAAVEAELQRCSDELLGELPGYDRTSGLTLQCRAARAVFARRQRTDRATTFKNLGTALALELISNRHLIPGEKRALVDSGLYGVAMTEPEMHYLEEHWGEVGAEAQHEKNAFAAVESVLDAETAPLLLAGADEFLRALASLWDVLDASLLQSGFITEDQAHPAGAA